MKFGRIYTAMVTPFNENLEVDYIKAGELALYLINNGSDGVIVSGTTGESPTLSIEEKVQLFKTVKAMVGDKGRVIAGTGSSDTRATIALTKQAEDAGVDACMVVSPAYNKPTQAALYDHFKMISESTALPIIVYNVPGRTSSNIEAQTTAKLSKLPNIVAVKEAAGSIDQVMEIMSLTDDDFMVYSGDDGLTLPMLAIGAQGVISVSSHVVGNEMQTMIRSFLNGDFAGAARINASLYPIYKGMFITSSPIPVKTALNLLGHEVGAMRMPMQLAEGEVLAKIKNTLMDYGLTVEA